MKTKISLFLLLGSFLTLLFFSSVTAIAAPNSKDSKGISFNDETYAVFMREEEKLARDVYIYLGSQWPKYPIFGNIDDSEQRHMDAVRALLIKFGISDPSTNDNIGVYTGKDYGEYFTEKYQLLTERGSISALEALYVGAYIEELDLLDITQCPEIIVELQDSIIDTDDCGLNYTENRSITKTFTNLLNGSRSHLRAFVKVIETIIGEGNYTAQALSQEEVNAILGR